MVDKKYNKVLTIVLVIIVVIAFIVLGFLGFDLVRKYYINKDANQAIEEFENKIKNVRNRVENTTTELDENLVIDFDMNEIGSIGGSNGSVAKQTYKGYTMLGRIEIPVINLNYPVLDRASEASMKVSVGVLYGVGLNQVGNTVIAGHNYRNGTFFSNLKKVDNGDVIYITDNSGTRLKYTVYNVYTTNSSDFDYASRDTAGKREISLTTCTDDVNARRVIWARED